MTSGLPTFFNTLLNETQLPHPHPALDHAAASSASGHHKPMSDALKQVVSGLRGSRPPHPLTSNLRSLTRTARSLAGAARDRHAPHRIGCASLGEKIRNHGSFVVIKDRKGNVLASYERDPETGTWHGYDMFDQPMMPPYHDPLKKLGELAMHSSRPYFHVQSVGGKALDVYDIDPPYGDDVHRHEEEHLHEEHFNDIKTPQDRHRG